MRKVPLVAVFWTFALALPFTILALVGMAYIDNHFSEIAAAIANLEQLTAAGTKTWAIEGSQRFPELAGMLIGLLVILTIYLFVRRSVRNSSRS